MVMSLTREQIDHFVTWHRNGCGVEYWHRYARLGLVEECPASGRTIVTPAGHDLLATVPHLPKPEPAKAVVPVCSRCGGETRVHLFMGPLMMPCPECRPSTDDATVIDASYSFGSMTHTEAQERIGAWSKSAFPISTASPGADWVHISEIATAKAFVGCVVQVYAPAFDNLQEHRSHGTVQLVDSAGSIGLGFRDGTGLLWARRGNVHLRLVAQ
jgi:hypothetical protein